MEIIPVTVGTDPEFAWSITDDRPGQYRGLLPAKFMLAQIKKTQPGIVNDKIPGKSDAITTDFGKIFADGSSWEMNPIAGTPGEVVHNMAKLFTASYEYGMRAAHGHKHLTLITEPSIPLDCRMLDKWGDPELAMFGCDPDKSIHERIVDPSKVDAPNHPWRYMGAHIHFGIEGMIRALGFGCTPEEFWLDDFQRVDDFILLCDATIGLMGILYDQVVQLSAEQRRTVYGQPGVYRFQPHGIEYRSPSNSWLLSKPRALAMLYLAEIVPSLFADGFANDISTYRTDIIETMVTGNVKAAEYLLNGIDDAICWDELTSRLIQAQDQAHMQVNNYAMEWGM